MKEEKEIKIAKVTYDAVKDVTVEEYFSEDKFAVDIFKAKYCQTKDAGTLETPADVFWRVAYSLAAVYEDDAPSVEAYAAEYFSLMWNGWFRPGGSILSGVGSKKKRSLANCTTVPLLEDNMESINKCEFDMMKCAAYRQGLGVDGSVLRPRGSAVNNAAEESSGAVPWLTKLSDIGKYVGQKGRRPAVLLSLKVDHPDIEEFVLSKLELGAIEDANISVQISNAFMDAVRADASWELKFEFEGNRYEPFVKTVSARELFDLISTTAYKSAEPGVQYIDLMREGSMVQQVYEYTNNERFKIVSTNACSEKPLPPWGICNLSSINMEMFSTDPAIYRKQLQIVVPYIVRMADSVVEYELIHGLSPVKEQQDILRGTREIGCGITNLHGWLLNADLAYDSDKAISMTEYFMKTYAEGVFKASVGLGKARGSAPAWDLVKDKKHFMGSIYFRNMVDTFYGGKPNRVKYMRNMAHMSIAPTGSLSSTFPRPCVSSGIEPIMGPFYWRKTRAVEKGVYTYYFVVPGRIQEYVLDKLDPATEDFKILSAFPGSVQDESGSQGKIISDIIMRNLPEGFFKPAHEIDPLKKIDLMAGVYKWVDACVSCTYNLPPTATEEDVKSIYQAAYDKGVRAVSVYVEGSREGVLLFEDPITNKAKYSGNKTTICDVRPLSITPNCAPKRPKELPCDIFHTSVNGEMWVVLVGLLEGELPFEVFCGPAEDLYIPKTCTSGKIIKAGGGKYSLEVTIRRSPVVYQDLAQTLMTDSQRALTRIISLGLRHGVPPKYLVSQMKKTNGLVTDFSKAISRVLSKYVGTYDIKEGESKCPKCGESSLVYTSGCIECSVPDCGYSRCG